jgi:phytoene synthase
MQHIYDWEEALIELADKPLRDQTAVNQTFSRDEELLRWAYAYCERITAMHSRSFYMASSLLPESKRAATRALYTFCRTTDDIVDHPYGETSQRLMHEQIARERLQSWRERALTWNPDSEDLVPLAWGDTCLRYGIPKAYAEQLIDGVARDLYQTRYQTFSDLTEYCYGVAATVGLMSMHIIGFQTTDAIPYAIRLGVALQMTNILRDVGEDWRRGRFYLPLTELEAFGLGEGDIERGLVTDRWRKFMRFQIDRTRQLYQAAWPGIALLALEGRVAIAAAADFYAAILDRIEHNDYDVFNQRAYVSGWGKARRVPTLYWRTRLKPLLSGRRNVS